MGNTKQLKELKFTVSLINLQHIQNVYKTDFQNASPWTPFMTFSEERSPTPFEFSQSYKQGQWMFVHPHTQLENQHFCVFD